MFANGFHIPAELPSGFLQIPPRDGHPCFWLTIPTIRARSGLAPYSCRPRRANEKSPLSLKKSGLKVQYSRIVVNQ
jgi:hypothetical protein